MFSALFDFLRAKSLALALMTIILLVVLTATIFLPAAKAQHIVFSSLWFNGLLVFLVVNTACCFFSRIRRRAWDLAFAGMVIFHLSFVSLFLGVVYDKLFFFRGDIRLTEGETLDLAESSSYDTALWGKLFDPPKKLRGKITMHRVTTHHLVDGQDKGVANEISFSADGRDEVRGIAYVTHHLAFDGVRYFRNKEGYSPCVTLYDADGGDVYGACVPLQSIRQKDETILYATGSPQRAEPIMFPQKPVQPLFGLQMQYFPDPKKERDGKMLFTVMGFPGEGKHGSDTIYEKMGALGTKVRVGAHDLVMTEVRHWASLNVQYNPGRYIIMISFWAGLGGISLTTVARLAKKRKGAFA